MFGQRFSSRLIKIVARIVGHGRYVAFQMASLTRAGLPNRAIGWLRFPWRWGGGTIFTNSRVI